MCGTGKNTMKAIESRQRGNKCHLGAFWSRGNGRNRKKDCEILERSNAL